MDVNCKIDKEVVCIREARDRWSGCEMSLGLVQTSLKFVSMFSFQSCAGYIR